MSASGCASNTGDWGENKVDGSCKHLFLASELPPNVTIELDIKYFSNNHLSKLKALYICLYLEILCLLILFIQASLTKLLRKPC